MPAAQYDSLQNDYVQAHTFSSYETIDHRVHPRSNWHLFPSNSLSKNMHILPMTLFLTWNNLMDCTRLARMTVLFICNNSPKNTTFRLNGICVHMERSTTQFTSHSNDSSLPHGTHSNEKNSLKWHFPFKCQSIGTPSLYVGIEIGLLESRISRTSVLHLVKTAYLTPIQLDQVILKLIKFLWKPP